MPQTRREFLKYAMAAGVATDLAGDRGASAAGKDAGKDADMPRRVLGRTKESVTILGLGCAYAGGGVSEARPRATIEAALEGGVRYFDAAPEYTQAEVRLAPVIKPVRDRVFLVTKSYAHDAKQAEKDLTQALEQLDTDHVDLFLQHGVGLKPMSETMRVLGRGGSLEFLVKAKKKGLTRFVGMSVHSPHATALRLLDESDDWDVVMPYINYVTRAQEEALAENDVEVETVSDYERLFSRARRRKLGIVGMKVLGGHPGKLADDFDRAFRYALSVKGVACALVGVRSPEQVRRAVRAAKAFRPLTEREMDKTIRIGEELVRKRSSKATILQQHIGRDFGSEYCA